MVQEDVILSVQNLSVELRGREGVVRAVDDVSFEVRRGEVLGIVGESGSGKSVSMLALMGLLPKSSIASLGGDARIGDIGLLGLNARAKNRLRGKRMSMIFQDPMSALNPLMTVGAQMMEAVGVHNRNLPRAQLRVRALELLVLVGIDQAEERFSAYPHQFSGGMRQRVMIAMALANDPEIILADEPTTALDVTVQAQILALLKDMKDRLGVAIVLITHDLGVIAEMADRVIVMYAGRNVESADVMALFDEPAHPYTSGLLASRPDIHSSGRLKSVPGTPPNLHMLPPGCRFFPRCPVGNDREVCQQVSPPLSDVADDHASACHFPEETSSIVWTTSVREELKAGD